MIRRFWLLPLIAVSLLSAAACSSGDGVPHDGSTPRAADTPNVTMRPTPMPAPTPNTPTPVRIATTTSRPRPGPTTAPRPDPGTPAEVIRLGNTGRRMVAFTFDAGSDAGFAAQILDTLNANGITASFGMTGKWAEKNPDLLRLIVNEGHSLINHTYDHASFTGRSTGRVALTLKERWEQLDRTEAIIRDLTGASTIPYFRPPYGDYDDSVNADVGARGYRYNVMWTVDSRGWRGIPAAEITQRCLKLAKPGALYVFHVGSASQDGPALQGVIDGLRAAGYGIGSIPDVLAP